MHSMMFLVFILSYVLFRYISAYTESKERNVSEKKLSLAPVIANEGRSKERYISISSLIPNNINYNRKKFKSNQRSRRLIHNSSGDCFEVETKTLKERTFKCVKVIWKCLENWYNNENIAKKAELEAERELNDKWNQVAVAIKEDKYDYPTKELKAISNNPLKFLVDEIDQVYKFLNKTENKVMPCVKIEFEDIKKHIIRSINILRECVAMKKVKELFSTKLPRIKFGK